MMDDEDTLILTANARLSSYLKKTHDIRQANLGKQTWLTLNCLPFNQWALQIAQNHLTTNSILNDAQELALWEKIISKSDNHHSIYQPFKIAEIARQSWRLLKQWRVSLEEISNSFSEDTRLFHQWATAFVKHCEKNQWHIQDDCTEILINAIQHKKVNLPQKIIISGFDELPPQKENIIHALQKHCDVSFGDGKEKNNTTSSRTPLLNEDEEILQMSLWAKNILEKNANSSIACIAPHLNQIRDKVISIFTQTFADNPISILNNQTLPFNISASRTFNENPLIHAAFQILSLNTKEIDLNKISALLRSPFIGHSQTEMTSRARLNFLLHQMEEIALPLSTAIYIAKKNALCPQLILDLKKFSNQLPSAREKKTLNEWRDTISNLLTSTGWPGERNLSSDEYQQHQRWQKLLIEFTQIGIIHSKPVTFSQAITQLKVLAQKTYFQSETQDMPIQILGMLEASGMAFDHLWVMGMNDDKWPQPPSPNPFIPIALQRKYNMPHASSEKEYSFSQNIMQRLQHSANNIIFSYSQQKEDNALRMSKLLASIPEQIINTEITPTENKTPLEALADNVAPPTPTHENARGGTSIIKDQSACPFKAFAKHRLGARTLPTPSSGLSPQEKGNLIHEILENIWTMLKDHKTLIAYNESDLDTLITQNISTALYKKSEHLSFTLKKQFILLEQQRLFKLIKQWLDIEKARPPFSIVAHETATKVDFEGLSMWLRIDREDKLENDEKIIIDYKTGLTKIESWFGQRPDDPQLPLYCLTSDHDIDGLLFAQIRLGKLQFKGITADDYHIDGVKNIETQKADTDITSWELFKKTQYQTLSKISKDFQTGNAAVDPKDPIKTCQYCDLQALCRVCT